MENDRRRYERYTLDNGEDTPAQVEFIAEGVSVRLVNFSAGGLYVLSQLPFSSSKINVLVNFRNSEKMELTGTIVRVRKEGDIWGIAIDLSRTYNLNIFREV